MEVPQHSSHPNPNFAPSDLTGPCGQTQSPYIYQPPSPPKQLVLCLPLKGAEFVVQNWTQASLLRSQMVERTSKGSLFGLILFSSILHYFPWHGLWPLPQAKSAL